MIEHLVLYAVQTHTALRFAKLQQPRPRLPDVMHRKLLHKPNSEVGRPPAILLITEHQFSSSLNVTAKTTAPTQKQTALEVSQQ